MKSFLVLGLAALCGTHVLAAPLKKATFTRVVNDVKLLPDQRQPVPAKVGDLVSGTTSVTTGVQSRAELKFEDNSLTRLGANSVFTIEQGTRNVDLKQGVMLLQVPKQLGGARVRTAAVTAAVTGTTVMIEYQPDGYVKVIVLEGEVDIFQNEDPSVFRKITAGDMIIMQPNAKQIPLPVQVDLPRLKATSKLTDEKEFGALGNEKHLKQADDTQNKAKKKGDLSETALKIPGKGNSVVVDADRIRDLFQNVTVTTPTTTTTTTDDRRTPPSKAGLPGLLGGVAVIDNTSLIITDPVIRARFSGTLATGQGKIYRPGIDAGLGRGFFQSDTRRLGADDLGPVPLMDQKLRDAGRWAAYKFQEAYLVGSPNVDTRGGPTNLLLASDSDFTLTDTDPFNSMSGDTGSWDLGVSTLHNVAIVARNNINVEPGYSISGTNQNLYFYTQVASTDEGYHTATYNTNPTSGDITVYSPSTVFSFPAGSVEMHAARDLSISGPLAVSPPTQVQAAKVDLSGDRNVNLGSNAGIRASESIKVRAGKNLNIYDSTILRRLTNTDLLSIQLLAESGDLNSLGGDERPVTIEGSSVDLEARIGNITLDRTNITADYLRIQSLGTDGSILIGNSNLTASQSMNIFAEGANGMVRFVADSRLSGPNVSIAGRTVQVDNGVNVNITHPNTFNVYSDNENFNRTGWGNFTTSGSNVHFVNQGSTGAHKGNFSSRP